MPVQRIFDAGLAVAVTLLCLYAAAEAPAPFVTGVHEPAGLTALAALALGAPLAVRRRWPLSVAAVVVIATALSLATGLVPDYSSVGPVIATGIALYAVAVEVPGRRGVIALAASAVLVAGSMAVAGDSTGGPGNMGVFAVVLALGACWLVGYTLRERRAHAVRALEQATGQAVAEERLRIAREIHDIVGHSLTVIAVKSAIGSHVAAQRPAEAAAVLDVIAATSRSALAELRRAVGALRTEPDFAPAPTLADLGRLADRAVAAGVAVELDVRNDCEIPDGVALAAVRIVQEALTNVVKHAGPTTCRVTVVGMPGELQVEVANDRPPGKRSHPGPLGTRPHNTRASKQPHHSQPPNTQLENQPPNTQTNDRPHNNQFENELSHSQTSGQAPNTRTDDQPHSSQLENQPPNIQTSEQTHHTKSYNRHHTIHTGGSPHNTEAGKQPHTIQIGKQTHTIQTGNHPDGAGLIGMRERVAMHSGALTVGPRDDGGFLVRAVLPYERVA